MFFTAYCNINNSWGTKAAPLTNLHITVLGLGKTYFFPYFFSSFLLFLRLYPVVFFSSLFPLFCHFLNFRFRLNTFKDDT